MKSQPELQNYRYLYGPVYSWRLGCSLGIDPLSASDKICNFDCIYCQLGATRHLSHERREYVAAADVLEEIESLPEDLKVEYLTFSGRGEPTLAANLGDMIRMLCKIRSEKIAVITNSSLLHRADVRDDLVLADFVLAKLDAFSQKTFEQVDHAVKGTDFAQIAHGIKAFREMFAGKLAVQIMFMNANKSDARDLADLVRLIAPDEVQLNTPLRPCRTSPLSREDMQEVKQCFHDLPVVSVYDQAMKELEPFQFKETVRRHGNFLRHNKPSPRKDVKNEMCSVTD